MREHQRLLAEAARLEKTITSIYGRYFGQILSAAVYEAQRRDPRRERRREDIQRDLEAAIARVAGENRELTAALAAWASIAAQIEVQFPQRVTLSAALA